MSAPSAPEAAPAPAPRRRPDDAPADRSWLARAWYESVRWVSLTMFAVAGGLRFSGREHLPAEGGVLLVSNHLSFFDVFVLGIPLRRRLNYVARSSLFVPGLATLIRSVGGFPIQMEGKGAQGLKETIKRLRQGAVVILFPEGSRSHDGRLGPLKPGIVLLAERARVPVLPAAVAGAFEAWPRTRKLPGAHAMRIVYGPPISPQEMEGKSLDEVTALIRGRIDACHRAALRALASDLRTEPLPPAESPLGRSGDLD